MHRMLLRVGLALFALTAALPACKPSSAPATTSAPGVAVSVQMRGLVERLGTDKAPRRLLIRHEATKDMGSMAMSFTVAEAVPIADLKVGDKIAFQVEMDMKTGGEVVTRIERLPADTVLNIKMPETTAATTTSAPATAPAAHNMPGM